MFADDTVSDCLVVLGMLRVISALEREIVSNEHV